MENLSILASLNEAQIAQALNHHSADAPRSNETPVSVATSTYAAVLLPLFREQNEWHLLFTHRTEEVRDHKGQVSFPGGSREPSDPDLKTTALRETFEEVGIRPEDVNILGRLTRIDTVTNYCITPYVGVIPWPYSLKIETAEVSHTFSIPLSWLADPSHWDDRWDPEYSPRFNRTIIFFQPYHGELLWGVSGWIVVNFLKRLNLA
jgi:8-oxo-dGTP pyrophosphatase MutT (NUDIX family)